MKIMDAASLIEAIEGPRISVPTTLVVQLGDITSAVFLAQAAYLSALSKEKEGWFDLPQIGPSNPASPLLWGKLGSWQSILGIGIDAQTAVRTRLKALGLLEEKRAGIPCRLHYRVRSDVYLAFLVKKFPKQPIPLQSDSCRIKTSGNPKSRLREIPNQDSEKTGNKTSKDPLAGSKKTPNLDSGKATDISREVFKAFKAAEAVEGGRPRDQEKTAAAGELATPKPGKRRRVRQSGIVTWDADDEMRAAAIESKHATAEIQRAIEALKSRGKQPLPGNVEWEFERSGEQIQSDEAVQVLTNLIGRVVQIADYPSPIRIGGSSNRFFGEVLGRGGGIVPHSQLISLFRQGAILSTP